MSQSTIKQPQERYTMGFGFTGYLPAGATLSSGTVSAVRLDTGAADNSVLDSLALTISGDQALVRVKDGLDGVDYKLTFLVTLSNGDVLEEDLIVQVRNL